MTDSQFDRRRFLLCSLGAALPFSLYSWSASAQTPARSTLTPLPRQPGTKPRNILFVLTDDHRYDAMGFLEQAGLSAHTGAGSPRARWRAFQECVRHDGALLAVASVHPHRPLRPPAPRRGQQSSDRSVADFLSAVSAAGRLRDCVHRQVAHGRRVAGERENDSPQPGFDHWVSFPGQGTYLPSKSGLNVNGLRVPQKGYITDELTDYALRWLDQRSAEQPVLYVSVAQGGAFGVHPGRASQRALRQRTLRTAGDMERDAGQGRTAADVGAEPAQQLAWRRLPVPRHARHRRVLQELLPKLCWQSTRASRRVLEHLQRRGLLDSTLVIYMGDNGFAFGEHGLIDKRTAYEESMRVPMLMHCPELFKAGTVVEQVVANIDIAPTFAGGGGPASLRGHIDGRSVLPLARGERVPWRESCCTSITGSATFRRRPPFTRCARTDTSTSAITASGTSMSCTICKPIRWKRTT